MSRELAALIRMGKSAYGEMDFLRAERLLREAVAGGAKYADIYYTLGLIEHQRGNFRLAVERFGEAVAANPDYTEALLSLSITLNDMGRYEEARSAYGKAADVLSRDGAQPQENMFRGRIANLHKELGELYLALGQFDRAITEFREAIAVAPWYPDIRIRLVVALREAGRPEEAMSEVDAYLAVSPGSAPALLQKGILHFLSGDRSLARRSWEEALYREPLNRIVQVYLNTLDRGTGEG
ncbi:MAG: Tetratricopeptide repeat protein [Deltaproteobacteria bacterium]|jgi:tetratricopeptide (TPR) repeat protein|nr:Tetratricopeptide repeat protein [Deltaproteobacteria bacterium]